MRARDLYQGELFKRARRVAEQWGDRWYILSAEHGLVDPTQYLAPYDKALSKMTRDQRKSWSREVAWTITTILEPDEDVVIFAGTPYREFLVPELERAGHRVFVPLAGLGIGQQLSALVQLVKRGPAS